MKLYDILYLDEPWLRSLASQREGDRRRRVRHVGTDIGGGKQTAAEGVVVHDRQGEATNATDEFDVLDDRLAGFLKLVEPTTVDLTETNVVSEASAAMGAGNLITASGWFFFDDFRATRRLLNDAATYMELQAKINAAPLQELASSLARAKKDNSNERRMLDQAAAQQKANAAAIEANQSAKVAQFKLMADITKTLFGDMVECGVVLGDDVDGHMVRAVLDPAQLRPSTQFALDRYGPRTKARFTVVGTVCRVGWEEDLHLSVSEELAAAAEEGDTLSAPKEEPKKAFLQAQTAALKARRLMMAGGDDRSVFVSPLAVFRGIPVPADPEKSSPVS